MLSRRAALSGIFLIAVPAAAHPLDEAPLPFVAQVEREITRFREDVLHAVKDKDVAKLEGSYAANYTHTHGSGRVDGRERRILSLVKGEPVIETAPVSDVVVRVYGADTAIVTGKSPILDMKDGQTYDYRWTQVIVRIVGRWQIASSQATKVAPSA